MTYSEKWMKEGYSYCANHDQHYRQYCSGCALDPQAGSEADVRLNNLLNAVADIRKADCGGWMKDCMGSMHRCIDGADKRMELGRLLHKLYRAAGI